MVAAFSLLLLAGLVARDIFRNEEIPMTACPLPVKVRHIATATIAYIRHVGPHKDDTALFRRLFTRLFAWAGPRGLTGPDTCCLSLMQRLEVALVVPAMESYLNTAIRIRNAATASRFVFRAAPVTLPHREPR
ncbi:MAG TPA: hypothetical protein VHC72_14900 [Bryobacteraceae bacterium]|nr:hypothetical protein [Bryobacteraceae bacterium]